MEADPRPERSLLPPERRGLDGSRSGILNDVLGQSHRLRGRDGARMRRFRNEVNLPVEQIHSLPTSTSFQRDQRRAGRAPPNFVRTMGESHGVVSGSVIGAMIPAPTTVGRRGATAAHPAATARTSARPIHAARFLDDCRCAQTLLQTTLRPEWCTTCLFAYTGKPEPRGCVV